jgi:uncharacterized DUF497 family protein
MRERGIAEAEIEEALTNTHAKYPSEEYPEDRVVVRGTTRNGRVLKVVVEATDPEYVVSVMQTG